MSNDFVLKDAYKLMHNGALALANMQMSGMPVDNEYLEKALIDEQEIIDSCAASARECSEYSKMEKMFQLPNLGSNDQLKKLFASLGHEPGSDKEYLDDLNTEFADHLLEMRKHIKLRNTYLLGLKKMSRNGKVHVPFMLHTAKTYRSSSSIFQNIPIRDETVGPIIRKAFRAPKDYHYGELDYTGLEVSIALCYHKDPSMLEYVQNPNKDMHTDTTMMMFGIKRDNVSKAARFCGKNNFVFPEFYGDYYVKCAEACWKRLNKFKVKDESGELLLDVLRSQGITSQKKLENRFKKIEHAFWYDMFPIYTDWKKKWIREYERKGYFDSLTGFRYKGVFRNNQVVNFPVQGAGFHVLLWSIIELDKHLRKYRMKTRLVNQIHDSIIPIIHKNEVDDFMGIAKEIMTEKARKHFPWIYFPIEVEAELSPLGGTWHEKTEFKIK